MLFVHQPPSNSPENRRTAKTALAALSPSAGDDFCLVAKGQRASSSSLANQRRPNSAVGSGPNGAPADAQVRHGNAGDRARPSPSSRPGSANTGYGRGGFCPQSSSTSAQPFHGHSHGKVSSGGACGNASVAQPAAARNAEALDGKDVADATKGASKPIARPVTPTVGRHHAHGGPVRASTTQHVRAPLTGLVPALPLHVTAVDRPRTPTNIRPRTPNAQRHTPRSGGSAGDRHSPANKIRPSAVGSVASTTASSSGSARSPASGLQCSGRESENSPSSNNLTTMISSALDYKRFLDKRKQLIQQQVECAQQAHVALRGDLASIGDRARHGKIKDDTGSSPAEAEGSAPVVNEAATSSSGATKGSSTGTIPCAGTVPTGRHSGAGPVRASHTMQTAIASVAAACAGQSATASVAAACAGHVANDETGGRLRSNSAGSAGIWRASHKGGACRTVGVEEHDASREDPGVSAPTSARNCGSSSAAQQLRLRTCVTPERDSSTGPGGVTSLPVGGAHQACRSFNRPEQRTDRGGGVQGKAEVCDERCGDGSLSALVKQLETSIDGLLGGSDSQAANGPLAGNAIEDYVIGKQLGQGSYATVCFGLHKVSSQRVAIKVYDKHKLLDPQRRKSVRCEIRLMERMKHPNIVSFHDAVDTSKQICIIMEFVSGGSLHHFLKKQPGRRLDDQVAKRILFQVCQGLRYMHDRHIVHRDIKLENLLLDESSNVKIIDFGFSMVVPPGKTLKVFCGTPSYMAPEIVARKEYSGFCADIWATGVLLYALLCGAFPFRGQSDRDLYKKIVRGLFHVPERASDGARNLLSRILTPDMTRRPTVDDVLSHEYMSSHRDDLQNEKNKAPCSGDQPNSSTWSTATTTAPSSSAAQSAREIVCPEQQGSIAPCAQSSGASSLGRVLAGRQACTFGAEAARAASCGPITANPVAAKSFVANVLSAPDCGTQDRGGQAVSMVPTGRDGDRVANATSNSMGTFFPGTDEVGQHCGAQGPAVAEGGGCAITGASSRRFEEEAINKLERLGYTREEILRQLKDESSHLFKLYHRFLKALTAWNSKK